MLVCSAGTALAAGLLSLTQLVLHAPVLTAAAPAAKIDMHAGTQLTPVNFNETTANGIWFVEHYSPWCHHCKAFVPTWKELVEARQHQAETINFHLGQVDCAAYGDLCDKNGVKGYPSIFLYENGEFVEHFKKERTLERINKWLDDRLPDDPVVSGSEVDDDTAEDPKPAEANADDADDDAAASQTALQYISEADAITGMTGEAVAAAALGAGKTAIVVGDGVRKQPPSSKESEESNPILQVQQHQAVQKRITPNSEGQVQHLMTEELETMLNPESSAGPTFVKYFAPWCGHCKHLAPIWQELAVALRNRVNVVEFDCDKAENKVKCRKEGIAGYPTLIFYQGGEKAEYRGARSLSQMNAFASKAALSTGLRNMSPAELNDVAQEDEVFFLYLYPAETPEKELDLVQTAASGLIGAAPVFKSSSPELFARLGYPATHPALLVFKDHELRPTDSLNFTTLRSASSTNNEMQGGRRKDAEAEISNWLHSRKFPTLAELTGTNFNDYLEGGQVKAPSYIALAALDPATDGAEAYQHDLRRIARAWRSAKQDSKVHGKPINFVWVNADKWSKYLSTTYAIRPNAGGEPLLIVVDPLSEKFYPLDATKRTIRIDQTQIFAALESLYNGRLTGISSSTVTDRFGKWLYRNFGWMFSWMGDHPIMAVIAGVVFFVMAFSVLVYYLDSDEYASPPGKAGSPPPHQARYVHNEKSLYAPAFTSGGVKKD